MEKVGQLLDFSEEEGKMSEAVGCSGECSAGTATLQQNWFKNMPKCWHAFQIPQILVCAHTGQTSLFYGGPPFNIQNNIQLLTFLFCFVFCRYNSTPPKVLQISCPNRSQLFWHRGGHTILCRWFLSPSLLVYSKGCNFITDCFSYDITVYMTSYQENIK